MTEYKRIDEGAYLQFGKKLSQEGKEKQILDSQIEFSPKNHNTPYILALFFQKCPKLFLGYL
jgi:hypothetical protein